MTRDEKIKAKLDSMTRDEKEDKMRESIWEWDTSVLVDYAMDAVMGPLGELKDEDFNDEYCEFFVCEFEDDEYDGDDVILKQALNSLKA